MNDDPWTMPLYLEPYRHLLIIDGGLTAEAVMNAGTVHKSLNDAVRHVSVAHQIGLLQLLMRDGLLLVAVPKTKRARKPTA